MTHFNRRALLTGLAGAALAPLAHADPLVAMPRRDGLLAFPERTSLIDLQTRFPERVEIAGFDYYPEEDGPGAFRVRATDGSVGEIFASHTKWAGLPQFFSEVVKPYFVGNDARNLEAHMVRFARREFEWSGTGLWTAWAHAELAILDLMARKANITVAELLGGVRRRDIPLYISSNIRGGDPAAEVAIVAERVAATGAQGVKIKVGGRMSLNRDAAPGWSEAIVRQTRAALGDRAIIYADANGSYDAPTAIALSRMLADFGVAMFEEPCPSEDITMTAQVARRTRIPIGGGENLAVMPSWRDAMAGAYDVVQPDPLYTGGMLRCLAIAREAERLGLGYNPHYPRDGAMAAPLIHLCATAPTLWGLQEYRLRNLPTTVPHESSYRVEGGVMRLPDEPGFGVRFDPAMWARAVPL